MIMKFLKKIPAGMMVVPMLLGAFINTFFPQVTGIGSFTTAIFTSAGANAAIGIQLFCLGTTLRFREIGGAFIMQIGRASCREESRSRWSPYH